MIATCIRTCKSRYAHGAQGTIAAAAGVPLPQVLRERGMIPMHDWLSITRGMHRCCSASRTRASICATRIRASSSPWLGAPRRGLVDRPSCTAFATELGATVVRTSVSRSVIDVNRDPSGRSLYPGMATTELCPTTTFDGEPLYRDGAEPSADEIDAAPPALFRALSRRAAHEAARLRELHRASSSTTATRSARAFRGCSTACCRNSISAATTARPAIRTERRRRCGLRRFRFRATCSTAASRAATSRAISADRPKACTRCRWNSPAAVICTSPKARYRRTTGRRASTPTYATPLRTVLHTVLERCLTFAQSPALIQA
jgi:N-formylglutamate deformylase